jgi:anti-anti-sigma factor
LTYFNELEFIDSTGMGAIINTIYLSQEKSFQLKLEGINEVIYEVFETVGLFQILEVIQKEIADVSR